MSPRVRITGRVRSLSHAVAKTSNRNYCLACACVTRRTMPTAKIRRNIPIGPAVSTYVYVILHPNRNAARKSQPPSRRLFPSLPPPLYSSSAKPIPFTYYSSYYAYMYVIYAYVCIHARSTRRAGSHGAGQPPTAAFVVARRSAYYIYS